MDKGTKIKKLLGYEITELEKELMPFLELQDNVELTEREKSFIIKQHMVARIARDNLLDQLNQPNLNKKLQKEVKKNAEQVFNNIMKATLDEILKRRKM